MEPNFKPVELSSEKVVLTGDEIRALYEQLRKMRHAVNNALAVLVPWFELIEMQHPELAATMATLKQQPPKVQECIKTFTVEFERKAGIIQRA